MSYNIGTASGINGVQVTGTAITGQTLVFNGSVWKPADSSNRDLTGTYIEQQVKKIRGTEVDPSIFANVGDVLTTVENTTYFTGPFRLATDGYFIWNNNFNTTVIERTNIITKETISIDLSAYTAGQSIGKVFINTLYSPYLFVGCLDLRVLVLNRFTHELVTICNLPNGFDADHMTVDGGNLWVGSDNNNYLLGYSFGDFNNPSVNSTSNVPLSGNVTDLIFDGTSIWVVENSYGLDRINGGVTSYAIPNAKAVAADGYGYVYVVTTDLFVNSFQVSNFPAAPLQSLSVSPTDLNSPTGVVYKEGSLWITNGGEAVGGSGAWITQINVGNPSSMSWSGNWGTPFYGSDRDLTLGEPITDPLSGFIYTACWSTNTSRNYGLRGLNFSNGVYDFTVIRPLKLGYQAPAGGAPSGTAGGDLSGNFPNPSVVSINGYLVSNTAPDDRQVLTWNQNINQWEPRNIDNLQTNNVSIAQPDDGGALVYDGNNTEWSSRLPAGDLGGTYISTTVSKIQGYVVDMNEFPPQDNNVLLWHQSTGESDNNGVSRWIPSQINTLQGNFVSSTAPNNNQILTWDSTGFSEAIGAWVPRNLQIGGQDVQSDSPPNAGDTLIYDGNTNSWKNKPGVSVTPKNIGHRLRLNNENPITSWGGSSNGSTVYFTPYISNIVELYNDTNTAWESHVIGQLSTSFVGYATEKVYDIFIFLNETTPQLSVSNAWTDSHTRADALEFFDGTWVKGGGGSNRRHRYLGTVYLSGDENIYDTEQDRHVWNYYNRLPQYLKVLEGTNSWTYTTADWRESNGGPANIGPNSNGATNFTFVCGMPDTYLDFNAMSLVSTTSGSSVAVSTGIGFTTTDNKSIPKGLVISSSTPMNYLHAKYEGFINSADGSFIGLNKVYWLEYGNDNVAFYGNNDDSTLFQAGMYGKVMG